MGNNKMRWEMKGIRLKRKRKMEGEQEYMRGNDEVKKRKKRRNEREEIK